MKAHVAANIPVNCLSNFWSSVIRIVPKNVKGGPFGDLRKSLKFEITCTKKFWPRAGLEPTSFCLADLKKSEAEEATIVWQLVEAS